MISFRKNTLHNRVPTALHKHNFIHKHSLILETTLHHNNTTLHHNTPQLTTPLDTTYHYFLTKKTAKINQLAMIIHLSQPSFSQPTPSFSTCLSSSPRFHHICNFGLQDHSQLQNLLHQSHVHSKVQTLLPLSLKQLNGTEPVLY